jgi:hypothetical protein
MPPVMQSVYSSHVSKIGHSPDTQELFVQWDNGKTSVYSGVSAQLAEDVRTSWSIGRAIQEQIKDKFPHRYDG